MSGGTPVDRLYGEAKAVIEKLGDGEPSLAVAAGDNFRKALLLAAASYFEYRITSDVLEFVSDRTGANSMVLQLVRGRAVARQYHTWFQWDLHNANSFFGILGSEFKTLMTKRVKASDNLRLAIAALMEVGRERNKLVHQDFASFALEKDLDEIYGLYERSLPFVEGLAAAMRDCDSGLAD